MIMGYFPILCGFLYEFFIIDLNILCGLLEVAIIPAGSSASLPPPVPLGVPP